MRGHVFAVVACCVAAASGVLAAPPPTLAIRAADLSALAVEDCNMTCNNFRAAVGAPPEDALRIFARAGFNTVRLRVWVNPTPEHPEGAAAYVASLAARAAAANLSIWLDFHLSDWWADPGHQTKPAAWVGLPLPALAAAVAAHVTDVLALVAAAGANVTIVQVGNEVSPGMLWPAAGEACADSGRIFAPCSVANWPALGMLLGAGLRAARAAVPRALLAMHTDLGNRGSYAASDAIAWYGRLAAELPADTTYDAIALSYYMKYNATGPAGEVPLAAALARAFPDKALLIAETSYGAAGVPPAGAAWPATPAGQLDFWSRTIAAAEAGGWAGVAWWGGEYAGAWTALFDEDFVARPALLGGWAAARGGP